MKLFHVLASVSALSLLERNPGLRNPQCMTQVSNEPDWEKRMKAAWVGIDFIRRHMLLDCPSNDPLDNIVRKIQHSRSVQLLSNKQDALDALKVTLGPKPFSSQDWELVKNVMPIMAKITDIIGMSRKMRVANHENLFKFYTGVSLAGGDSSLLQKTNESVLEDINFEKLKDFTLADWTKWHDLLETSFQENTIRSLIEGFYKFMHVNCRDIVILMDTFPVDAIVNDRVIKPFYKKLSELATIKNDHDWQTKVQDLVSEHVAILKGYAHGAIGEINPPPTGLNEQKWRGLEAIEALRLLAQRFKPGSPTLKLIDELLQGEVLSAQQLSLIKGNGPDRRTIFELDWSNLPVLSEVCLERCQVVREMAARCLGGIDCTLSGSLIMLHQKHLLTTERLIELWPAVEVKSQAMSLWFKDRLVKHAGNTVFGDSKGIKSSQIVQMVLVGLKRLRAKPDFPFLSGWQERLNDLAAKLMQLSWSESYTWLCANQLLIDNLAVGDLALIFPGCHDHATAALVERREADYLYHLLNTGAGINKHAEAKDEDGRTVNLPVASYVVTRELLQNSMDWVSSDWPIGLLEDYSLIYPPVPRVEAAYEGITSLYTKSQQAGTCLAKSVRLAVQFLLGEPFYRLIKSEIALLYLPDMMNSIPEATNMDSVEAYWLLYRWNTGAKEDLPVRIAVALNTLLSLVERVLYSSQQTKIPRWLNILNKAILANAEQGRAVIASPLFQNLYADSMNELRKNLAKGVGKIAEEDENYSAARSWCSLEVYHPFLFGYQPFVGKKIAAEELWRTNCMLDPAVKKAVDSDDAEGVDKLRQMQTGNISSLFINIIEDHFSKEISNGSEDLKVEDFELTENQPQQQSNKSTQRGWYFW